MEAPCFYVRAGDPEATSLTLERAARRAGELDIRNVVVASSTGRTGLLAVPFFKGRNLVVVSHSTGFSKPGVQELRPGVRRRLEAEGARVLTCQHAFGGVGRAVRKKWGTYELEEILAMTLRVFGQGVKVAVEIALMAADAGLISTREPCLCLGGTSGGADTALLLRPANAQTFFDLRVMEILVKPRLD
ncbi:MAG: hypothetical protein JW747_09210 [Candidatus Aminicenantes bacterium]|nr:hypothetical protein [Candidatus Aminicenantes bacterium]